MESLAYRARQEFLEKMDPTASKGKKGKKVTQDTVESEVYRDLEDAKEMLVKMDEQVFLGLVCGQWRAKM